MREQRVVLEHRVDAAPVGRHALDRLAEDADVARGRLVEAGDQPEAGGLAGARGPEHGEERALGDREVHAVDGAHLAEMAGDVLEFDRKVDAAHRRKAGGRGGPPRSQRPPITPI